MSKPTELHPREGFAALLVAVDLTPASDRVIRRVALLPLARGARVTLLHVVPDDLTVPDQRRAKRDARKALAEEALHLARSLRPDVRVVPIVTVGTPAAEIAAQSVEVSAEMIAMGRGGGRALREAFVGSTAERVIRRTRLPTLVVRLPARGTYRRPALALDLDETASGALAELLKVVPASPPLTVIHAFDPPYRHLVYPSLSEEDAAEDREHSRRAAARQIGDLVASALAAARVPEKDAPRWTAHVQHGSARSVVTRAVAKLETDLLVLGTRGHSGAAYVFLGTVAGDVLRAVGCDVLVVPPRPRRRAGEGGPRRMKTSIETEERR